MDKRRPSEQLMDTRYHLFINAAQTFKDKPQKSKEIAILLKECNMPCSSSYSIHYQRVGIIIKKGNLFMLNPELSRKEFGDKYALMCNSFQKSLKKERPEDNSTPSNLTKITDEFCIKFLLKTGKYRVQKLVKVPVTVFEDRWEDCK